MGYTTEFSGAIELSRALTASEAQELIDFSEERHGGNTTVHAGYPDFWCQWVPTADGKGIEWDGGEKFYSAAEWMQLVIDRFIAPRGIIANGTINAVGEASGDLWRLRVEDNRVQVVRAQIVWKDV